MQSSEEAKKKEETIKKKFLENIPRIVESHQVFSSRNSNKFLKRISTLKNLYQNTSSEETWKHYTQERLPTGNKQQFDADLSVAIVGAGTHNAEEEYCQN